MKLSALAGASFDPDPEITGLTPDSRAVKPGFLFAALPGVASDGADFIAQAEKNGAAAILARPGARTNLPLLEDAAPRRRLANLASRFYSRCPAMIAGVTGTNGKTSTAIFTAALWTMTGANAGSLGTLGASAATFNRPLSHTTPEPVTLHQTLEQMADSNVTHLIMEVSSHALAQYRADGVSFAIGAFTNITQDHLDYHAGFDDYFRAKLRLFDDLVATGGAAVINADGEGADEVEAHAKKRGLSVLTTGVKGKTLRLVSLTPEADGLSIEVEAARKNWRLRLPLIGAFQAENALLAAGVVIASGQDAEAVIPLLARLPGVPGRMQFVAARAGAGVYVDYAHTPDAIATALAAIRPHASGRVIIILGAGGDRDKGKRPLMGAAAASGADIVIVTDDNPRSETPAEIRRAVLAGAPSAIEIGDRAAAIRAGAAMLKSGDVLLIAGKGHETGQIVGREVLPFNDGDIARQAVREIGG